MQEEAPSAQTPRQGPKTSAATTFRTALPWMILALVIERPSYGYAILGRCQERFSSFLNVSQSMVYQVLERLEQHELIERVAIDGEISRRRRRQLERRQVFKATAAGVREYRRWAGEAMPPEPAHVELLGRLSTVCILGRAAMRDVIDSYAQQWQLEQQAARSDAVDVPLAADARADELAAVLIAERQRLTQAAHEKWIDLARQRIATSRG